MNPLLKIFVVLLLSVVLSSCSGLTSKKYSCETTQQWMAAVKVLAYGIELKHLPAAKLVYRVAPAYNDDVFKPIFKKTFSDLNKREREGIRLALLRCHPTALVGFGLSVPFQERRKLDGSQALWHQGIKRAQSQPYYQVIAQRQRQREQLKLAAKRNAEQRRRAVVAARKRQQQSNDTFTTIVKGAAVILGGLILADAMTTGEDTSKYSEYGGCASALRKRLVSCRTSVGECSETGCANAVDCDKGWSGRSCENRIRSILYPKNYYYCDTDNSRNYDSNRDVVIKQICQTK